jgi:hypothetical protein
MNSLLTTDSDTATGDRLQPSRAPQGQDVARAHRRRCFVRGASLFVRFALADTPLNRHRQAAKAYEKHCEENGKPASHALAKELLAGFAGAFVDRMVESKGVRTISTLPALLYSKFGEYSNLAFVVGRRRGAKGEAQRRVFVFLLRVKRMRV